MESFKQFSQHILLLCLCITYAYGSFLEGTVYMDKGKARFVPGKMDRKGAAYGTFNNSLLATGWNVLNINAGFGKKPITNVDLAFAAGYFEGVTTSLQIWQNYQNLFPSFFDKNSPDYNVTLERTKKFMDEQEIWMRGMIKEKGTKDPFWRHMSYIVAQFDGLYAGYKSVANSSWATDKFVVQMLNGVGDLLDLRHALVPNTRPDFHKMTPQQLQTYVRTTGHCSALVKVTGAYENLFMAHSSWFIYESTHRIYKHYNFNFRDDATAAKNISFSSYPGFLESLDDFYTLGSGLVVLQTTNNIFNLSLYHSVQPHSLLAWHRVRAANYMAHSGKEWAEVMRRHNSGTYNNQYMVIDLNRVELERTLHDGTLWVVEQIPTLVEAGDLTPILRAGYWPSYNVPYFETIYNMSGYTNFDFSYELAPRAKIFRRDQTNVTSLNAMKYIMRYNDYHHDPYSGGDACNAICCRGDLSMFQKTDGCYDSKVTDYHMALQRESFAISGPTWGGKSDLKPFTWDGVFEHHHHTGLPWTYKFPWVHMSPNRNL